MVNKFFTFSKSLIFIPAFFIFAAFYISSTQNSSHLPLIVVTQIIDHHTLDEVRTSMIQGLNDHGWVDGKTATIIYENANGNVSVATEIAKKFINLQPKVIVALSTQSAQTLLPLARQAHIPLVFTAVTDPISAKLVASYTQTQNGVTGVSDFMPPEPQLEMIRTFLPHLKKLGVLYNPSEVNSVAILKRMEQLAAQYNITFVYAAAHNTSEVVSATKSLIGQVDALYFPNDNTVMAAAAAVAKTANMSKAPVFANDSASVAQGVLAAVAYDRKAMGRKTADMIAGLMDGKTTADFPVTHDIPYQVVTNAQTQKILGIPMPPAYQQG